MINILNSDQAYVREKSFQCQSDKKKIYHCPNLNCRNSRKRKSFADNSLIRSRMWQGFNWEGKSTIHEKLILLA